MCWENKEKEKERMKRKMIIEEERKKVEKYSDNIIKSKVEKLDNMCVTCSLSSHNKELRNPYQMICDF